VSDGSRVTLPEIGPYLGRLAEATHRFEDPTVGLDALRLTMVSDLFERAHAARGFLLTDDRAGARTALDRPGWLEIWRSTAEQAADRTLAAIRARMIAAQQQSGCPGRLLQRRLPTQEDREILAAKLDAAGIPLETQVARGFPSGDGWWEAVRRSAVALEDSWEQLEEAVRAALRAAEPEVAALERWRPSPTPWLVGVGCLTLVAGWLGLVLGGYLPRPSWLDWLHRAFWSLPWP
jgi:hypothetical protein